MVAEKSLRVKILTNKFLPIVLLILNIYLFFYAIPDHIAQDYQIILAILGGVITLVLSFWIFLFSIPKLFDALPIISGILCISTLFVFGFFFISKTTHFSSNDLKENGVLTEALIVDKTKMYGRRGRTITSMEVAFKTKSNEEHQATIDISEREYNSYEEGETIQIYYSSKHPNIARIAYAKNN